MNETFTLTDIPTHELIAELERRRLAALPPEVQFFGVWPGERAGHFLRDRYGRMLREAEVFPGRDAGLYPWTDGWRREQPEGLLWYAHHHGMQRTLLTSWDRSADRRGNCCAAFLVHAIVLPDAALTLARENFPAVFARIEAHLGRAVQLAGHASEVA